MPALEAVWNCQIPSHWWFIFWNPCSDPSGSDKGSWLSEFMVAVTMRRRNDPECTAPIKKQKKRVAELALNLSAASGDEPPSSVNHAAKGTLAHVTWGHCPSGYLNPWCLNWPEHSLLPLRKIRQVLQRDVGCSLSSFLPIPLGMCNLFEIKNWHFCSNALVLWLVVQQVALFCCLKPVGSSGEHWVPCALNCC